VTKLNFPVVKEEKGAYASVTHPDLPYEIIVNYLDNTYTILNTETQDEMCFCKDDFARLMTILGIAQRYPKLMRGLE